MSADATRLPKEFLTFVEAVAGNALRYFAPACANIDEGTLGSGEAGAVHGNV